MKKLMFIFTVAASLFLNACNNQALSPDSPIDPLESAINASSVREAIVKDSVTAKHCKGKLTAVDPATLSTTITDYINANYAGAVIEFSGKDEIGKIAVGLSVAGVRSGLIFDENGAFLKKIDRLHEKTKLTKVEIASLPATITAYIAANFAGFTASKAGKTTDGSFIVGLKGATTGHKVLKFDANGIFVEEKQIPPHESKPGGHGDHKNK